jgi:hypothetical protein
MRGFASWEIFGTGFEILIFSRFSRNVQVSKFRIFCGFLRFSEYQKKSQNADFSTVSQDFEGKACPKIFHGFSRNEQGSKSGFSRNVLQFLGGPKKSRNAVFPADSRDFKGWAHPIFFGTRTSPQFSWDFEVLDPPKKLVNPRTYLRFSWDFKGMDPPAKTSHWTANPGSREV